MASNIVKPTDFNPKEHLLFTKPKTNNAGGKSIGMLNSQTKRSIMISTPLMMNWGVNVYENQGTGSSYSLSLQFPREEFSNPEADAFLNMLEELETKVLEDAIKNSKEWFGKVQSKDVIEAFWNPILKYPKNQETGDPDKSRRPTLKVKLPTWDGEFKFELFDVENKMLIPNGDGKTPEEFIEKGSNIACILQCGGVWLANGNFGVSWKLYQGVVKQTERLAKGTCHIQISSDEKEEMNNDKTADFKDENSETNTTTTMVESDEEEAEAEEAPAEEVVEEPKPAPKKKRVVKGKSK